LSRQPRPMRHGAANEGISEGLEKSGKKAVHPLERGQAEESVTPERLETAGGIRTIVVQERLTNTIRESRGEPPRPGIAPVRADSGDQRKRLASRPGQFHKAKDILGAVLTVAVHGHDPWRGRRPDTGDQGRRLAATAIVPQHADRGVPIPKHPETFGGCIIAAVIDVDQFERSRGGDCPQNFLSHRSDVVRFIVYGNDNRKAGSATQRGRACDRICSR
jgi:hypothetical protein